MKYYEDLLILGCFTFREIIEITGSEAAAKWLVMEYQKKGLIERVKQNLYVAINIADRQPMVSRYRIASSLSHDAVVSYHSAFEFYGYSNQVFNEVYVSTKTRFRNFIYNGIEYKRMSDGISAGIETSSMGERVTTIERTVLDCIDHLDRACGLEEFLRILAVIPSLDEKEMIKLLPLYNNGFLYMKTGYVLSFFSKELNLSDRFFVFCRQRLPNCKAYLYKGGRGFSYIDEWKLYAPKDIKNITNKGMPLDAEI